MAISRRVQNELLPDQPVNPVLSSASTAQDQSVVQQGSLSSSSTLDLRHQLNGLYTNQPRYKTWTNQEHERFLQAVQLFPSGPWKRIAMHVGTKTARQTMTHAQKYREKLARRKRDTPQMRFRRLLHLYRNETSLSAISTMPQPRATPQCHNGNHQQCPWLPAEELDLEVLAAVMQKPRSVASVSFVREGSQVSSSRSLKSSNNTCSGEGQEDHNDTNEIDVDALMDLFGYHTTTSTFRTAETTVGADPMEPLPFQPPGAKSMQYLI